MGADNVAIPVTAMGVKEIKMIGSFRYGAGDYPLAISMVERGLIDLKPLRTHEYSFKDAAIAFETTANGKDAHGKVSMKCVSIQALADERVGRYQVYHRCSFIKLGTMAILIRV
jgi:D-xylulose reductase